MVPEPESGEREDAGAAGPDGPSWGNISDRHWSRARRDANREAIEHYRARSRAPGVAEGGTSRNQYCPECRGVLPLAYDQRRPAASERVACPHCGAELDPRIHEHFNWVEIDQPPSGDAAALLPIALAGLAVLALVAGAVWWALA